MDSAIKEILSGFADWRRWAWLGLYDVKLQNRRSFVGTWWSVLSNAIFVFGVGYLFSYLMDRPIEVFLPHIGAGYIVWQFILGNVSQAGTVFVSYQKIILEALLPINTLILRGLVTSAIQLAMSAWLIAAVLVYTQVLPGPFVYLALAGVVLNLAVLHGAMLFIAIVSARFRDFRHLVDAGMRLVFFLTPIIWMPNPADETRSMLMAFNPFYYMVEVIRAPIVQPTVQMDLYAIVLGMAVFTNLAGLVAFLFARRRLVYWL
ncbi:ABC transporter permease [Maricaulis sp.]|uniref:ABC transporter permease n=1 Tax=Maricaulis sp. TaxID=1486257 RepID=UPI00261DC367|nr:ABC transporter permease [Maricaulis sp.]